MHWRTRLTWIITRITVSLLRHSRTRQTGANQHQRPTGNALIRQNPTKCLRIYQCSVNWHLVITNVNIFTILCNYQSQKHQYPPLLPFELVMSCGSVHSTVAIVLGMFSEIRHNMFDNCFPGYDDKAPFK